MSKFGKRLFDSREPQGGGLFGRLTAPDRSKFGKLSSVSAVGLLSKPRARAGAAKLEVEPLEPRILLSADMAPFAAR